MRGMRLLNFRRLSLVFGVSAASVIRRTRESAVCCTFFLPSAYVCDRLAILWAVSLMRSAFFRGSFSRTMYSSCAMNSCVPCTVLGSL